MDADSFAAGLDDGQRAAFETVRELARGMGVPAYLVGGPVRDALLGAPGLDLDFAVEGDAVGLARMVSGRLGGGVTAHGRFGTATVSAGELRIDLVTARRESYRRPGALPTVTPGNIGDDLARRDFTVNAMALPLSHPGAGVLDPLGGQDDLKSGIVRALHPRSFVDDPTRMMRAARYEQRFGFSIDKETRDAMYRAVAAGRMDAVSGDRWRHEVERMLEEANPVAPLLRAAELGLLAGLYPAFRPGAKGAAGLQRLEGLRQAQGAVEPADCLAALFGGLSGPEGEGVIQRLRLSGRRAALGRDTIGLRESEPQIRASAGCPSELARLLAGRELAAVCAWAKLSADPAVSEALRRYARELRFVAPELTGKALLDMGVTEGPLVGEILLLLRNARLDGAVSGLDEEVALAQALLAQSSVGFAGQRF